MFVKDKIKYIILFWILIITILFLPYILIPKINVFDYMIRHKNYVLFNNNEITNKELYYKNGELVHSEDKLDNFTKISFIDRIDCQPFEWFGDENYIYRTRKNCGNGIGFDQFSYINDKIVLFRMSYDFNYDQGVDGLLVSNISMKFYAFSGTKENIKNKNMSTATELDSNYITSDEKQQVFQDFCNNFFDQAISKTPFDYNFLGVCNVIYNKNPLAYEKINNEDILYRYKIINLKTLKGVINE